MEILRLVVTGTVGSGKSTFVRSVSEIEVVDTERFCTDEAALLKEKTTVAFDFGRLNYSSDVALHLYGTPGQFRFDFMWDILIQDADAYILLIPAHRPNDISKAHQILTFMNQRVQIPSIIGLTHTDRPGAVSAENVAIALGYPEEKNRPLIVSMNATQTASVSQALHHIVQHCQQNSVNLNNFRKT